MSAGWISVHCIESPERTILLSTRLVQAIGSDPEGGSRIVLTSGQHYDVLEDLDVLAAELTRAGR